MSVSNVGVVTEGGILTAENLWVNAGYQGLWLRDGVVRAVVRNSSFHTSASGVGIVVSTNKDSQYPTTAVIEHCEMSQNNTGLLVSQFAASPVISVSLSDNVIAQNSTGVQFYNTPQVFSYRNNVFSGNSGDGAALQAAAFK